MSSSQGRLLGPLDRFLARHYLRNGRVVAHNDVQLWHRYPAQSIRKYAFEPNADAAWEEAWALTAATLASVDSPWKGTPFEPVLENALMGALFGICSHSLTLDGIRRTHGADVLDITGAYAKLPFAVSRAISALVEAASAWRTSAPTAGTRTVPRPPGRAPVVWLSFSGFAPGLALSRLLPCCDPARTVALVVAESTHPRIVAELDRLGVSRHGVHPCARCSRSEYRGFLRRVQAALACRLEPAQRLLATPAVAGIISYFLAARAAALAIATHWRDGDILVTGNDRVPCQGALAALGKQRGLRTVTLQDGLFGASRIYTNFPSDRIGVLGHHFRELVLKGGRSADDVFVVGADSTQCSEGSAEADRAKAHWFKTNRKVAVFAAQASAVPDLETHDMLCLCVGEFRKRTDWKFFVKPHPAYPISHILRCIPDVADSVVTGPISEVIQGCDLMLSKHSTVLLEAASAGKAAASVALGGGMVISGALGQQGIALLRCSQELHAFISERPMVNVERFRYQYNLPFDGQAAWRMLFG